jgi:hypothetical protein
MSLFGAPKFNAELRRKLRYEQRRLSELSVAEFRLLMLECFDADRRVQQERKRNAEFNQRFDRFVAETQKRASSLTHLEIRNKVA